ncbi:unnamed protein product [Lactuca saligna]|uniref:ATP-dependent DNA helicase n=1 Tax=Lactuca saligna TaxID=75948 RepID=A0AA36E3X9_LACSI|nr:unnamed protein product [Lactuca saligna]
MHNVEEYDAIVSAEIPNEMSNPHLFRMVMKHMIHGPCGDLNPLNVCMKKGFCKNLYPKAFCCETTQTDDTYPTYRRCNDGVKVMVRGVELDNRWVVPYNPYLLCRWISPPEAAWRIFRFPLGEIKPTVIHLPLHLEDYQPINFKKKEHLTDIVANSSKRKTMLTEFFVQNKTDRYAQHLNLTYVEFPNHFVWKSNKKIWSPTQTEKSIGRIVVTHPSEDLSYADLDDETKEIKAEKSIIVSEDDLKSIHDLNKKQKVAFDKIIGKVKANKSGAFFINGPGGTWKTFIYRALLTNIRSEGHIALAIATSDIVASLLPGGRTAHSRFKIP